MYVDTAFSPCVLLATPYLCTLHSFLVLQSSSAATRSPMTCCTRLAVPERAVDEMIEETMKANMRSDRHDVLPCLLENEGAWGVEEVSEDRYTRKWGSPFLSAPVFAYLLGAPRILLSQQAGEKMAAVGPCTLSFIVSSSISSTTRFVVGPAVCRSQVTSGLVTTEEYRGGSQTIRACTSTTSREGGRGEKRSRCDSAFAFMDGHTHCIYQF